MSEFWSDHMSGDTPKATVTGVRLARRIMHFDASLSQAELEFSPRPIREAVADAVQWLHQAGQIAMPARG
jgi:dihydroflavonol-4-reductase